MIVREVQEDLVPKVQQFLCDVKAFGTFRHWGPLFDYSWKIAEFPYGYALVDGEQICGFLGTIYARRTINGKSILSCNMTTWVIDEVYRTGLGKAGKGLGKRLVEPTLAHKNVVVTNLTPSLPSAKSCESMGFRHLDSEQMVIPIFPGFRGWPRSGSGRKAEISFKSGGISSCLNAKERKVFDDHLGLPCKHFLITSSNSGEYCYGIFTTGPIRRLRSIGGKVLNLCYLSNSELFARHFWSFAGLLWKEDRIAVVRYDRRLIPQPVSKIAKSVPVTRLFHSSDLEASQVDSLYSELVLYNKY